MIVEVYRDAGDRSGQPITTPLLPDHMLIVRGKAEMDANAHRFIEYSGEIIFRDGMRLGQLCESPSVVTGSGVRSKLTGISIAINLTDGPDPTLDVAVNIKLRQPV